MKTGDYVRMTPALKAKMRGLCKPGYHPGLVNPDPVMPDDDCTNCSTAHIEEFGNCVGIVADQLDYNNVPCTDPQYDPLKVGPEWNVYWEPSGLRYGYDPEDLEPVSTIEFCLHWAINIPHKIIRRCWLIAWCRLTEK